MYQFGIDYSTLSKDPNATKGAGGFGPGILAWRARRATYTA